jgi:DNA ligase (NAD+)
VASPEGPGEHSDIASARIAELRSLIAQHNLAYYERDEPTIPDSEYDALVRELRSLIGDAEDDPTLSNVGGAPSSLFGEVEHRVPMMSLDNAMDRDELRDWGERTARRLVDAGLDPSATRFVCELKIDGLAMSVRYEAGHYVQAATRGNGKVGEDVTPNVAGINAIVHTLTNSQGAAAIPEVLEVRGEVYMPVAAFDALNAAQEEAGLRRYANPRNTAAGSLA